MIARICYWLSMVLIANRRPPDQIIYRDNGEYLRRWWVLGGKADGEKHGPDSAPRERTARRPFGWCWYLHQFVQSDDDRAMHDHPWRWWSFLLRDNYYEFTPYKYNDDGTPNPSGTNIKFYRAGDFRSGQATDIHRIELLRNARRQEIPVWTWFFMGPWERAWGFWCPKGWKYWREFDRDGGC